MEEDIKISSLINPQQINYHKNEPLNAKNIFNGLFLLINKNPFVITQGKLISTKIF